MRYSQAKKVYLYFFILCNNEFFVSQQWFSIIYFSILKKFNCQFVKIFSGFHSIPNSCGSQQALVRDGQKTKIPRNLQARKVYLHANRPFCLKSNTAAGQDWQTKTVYVSFFCSNMPPCLFMPTSSIFYQLITIPHRGDNPKGAITRSIYLFLVKPQSEILHNVWGKGVCSNTSPCHYPNLINLLSTHNLLAQGRQSQRCNYKIYLLVLSQTTVRNTTQCLR